MHCSGECAVDSSGECVGERSVVENALENAVGNALQKCSAVENALEDAGGKYWRMQGRRPGSIRS